MFGHNWTWASICCAMVAAGSPSNVCSAGKKGNCSAGGGKNNWSRDLVVKLQTLTYVTATSVAATANPVTEFTALRALANKSNKHATCDQIRSCSMSCGPQSLYLLAVSYLATDILGK